MMKLSPNTNSAKLCVNCKHIRVVHSPVRDNYKCRLYGEMCLVTGQVVLEDAKTVRQDDEKCGMQGLQFCPISLIPH